MPNWLKKLFPSKLEKELKAIANTARLDADIEEQLAIEEFVKEHYTEMYTVIFKAATNGLYYIDVCDFVERCPSSKSLGSRRIVQEFARQTGIRYRNDRNCDWLEWG